MERNEPILFKSYPELKGKVPWIPILTNVPTQVERLTELEKHLKLQNGAIYIKRDDINHNIYGGNKLRKFEFIFGNAIKKKKKRILTSGGIGTNHGLACAIVAKNLDPPLKCDLFLARQPLTWHVQRSLLLYNHFGAKIHYANSYLMTALKAIIFHFLHRKNYFMFPGGSPVLGVGTPLGSIGFINAIFELKSQIDKGDIPEPDAIFVPGGSTGTGAGLIAGCKVLGLKTRVKIVQVMDDSFMNIGAVVRNSNKAVKYLNKRDPNFPKIEINKTDFDVITGFLGTEYGVKTKRGQSAVDIIMDLEGKKRDFKLETTYTGKTVAGIFDFFKNKDNISKIVLFWNTYNSNDLDKYLKETQFNWNKLPKKFHKFYEETKFQCWQIKDCHLENFEDCPAYLNHEYRCWKVKGCSTEEQEKCKAYNPLKDIIELEEA
jgi:D-cysteine desulfhydrase